MHGDSTETSHPKSLIHGMNSTAADEDDGKGAELPVVSSLATANNTNSRSNEYIVDLDEDNFIDDEDDESEDAEYGNSESRFHSLSKPSSTTKRPFSSSTPSSNSHEYRTSVRRQNCFFGVSVLSLTIAFIATYLLMGLSFTPANIGIFGDESSRKGKSGKLRMDLLMLIHHSHCLISHA